MTDPELLRHFSSHANTAASNAAFTQLVTRHAGLVYAAALRQTRSTALAADITQSVFLDLAKNARRLRPDTHLPSWLIAVTRRTAIDAIRSESRRRTREQTSADLAAVNSPPTPDSSASDLTPVLDDALTSLSDTDRRAVLLRFFENQSFQQIARHLGATEASAQKRVSRALEKLRSTLARRGIAASATLLAAQLPLHANTTVPTSLTTTLAAPAFLASTLTTAASTSLIKTLLVTATHKTILISALTLAAGGLFYQAHRISSLHRDSAAMHSALVKDRQQLALLAEKLRSAQTASDSTHQQDFAASDPFAVHLRALLARIHQLKQRLAASPEEATPEISLLEEDRWIQIANFHDLTNAASFRSALSDLRTDASRVFSNKLQRALHAYLAKHSNTLPGQISELHPYFDSPVDPSMLNRYEVITPGGAARRSGNPILIQQKFSTIVDEEYDSLVQITFNSTSTVQVSQLRRELAKATPEGKEKDRLEGVLSAAIKKYQDANPGKRPDTPMKITPYFENPADAARVFEMLKARQIKPPTVDTP